MPKPSLHARMKQNNPTPAVIETPAPAPMPAKKPTPASKPTPVSKGGALALAVENLPDVYGGELVAVEPTVPFGAYIAFASTRAEKWGEYAGRIPGLREGDALLIRGEDVIKLDPCRVHLVCAHQYWAQFDEGTYDLAAVSLTRQPTRGEDRWAECVECVVLVYLPDGSIEPARVTFRKGQTRASSTLALALREAGTPAWSAKSPSHAETLALPRPAFRFYGVITAGKKLGKGGGNTFNIASASIHPSGRTEAIALGKFFSDPSKRSSHDEIIAAHRARVEEVNAMAQ